MKLSRDTKLFLRKSLIWFLIIFAASLIQTSFLAVLEPIGAVPDLVLLVSMGAGYFVSRYQGAIFGLASGVIIYALGDIGLAFLPIVYALAGFLAGVLVEKIFKGKFAVWCIYCVGGALFKAVYSLFCTIVFSGEFQLWAVLGRTVLPELVGTVLLGAALYVPIRKITKIL